MVKDLLKDSKAYQDLANQKKPKPNLAKNLSLAFLTGGESAPWVSSCKTSTSSILTFPRKRPEILPPLP